MIVKERYEPRTLQIFRSLQLRMYLTEKEVNYYRSLEKGFEGEKYFDTLINSLLDKFIIINDLLLEMNNSLFQIDSVLISRSKVFLFEVKNYEGDYVIKDERWLSSSKSEIKDPTVQLKRSDSLFRRLLQEIGSNFDVESYLVFVNPEFHLYQAPENTSIVFPTQLKRFIHKLSNTSPFTPNDKQKQLAKRLLALHLDETPHMRLPKYNYNNLKRGIPCASCYLFDVRYERPKLVCNQCGHIEWNESGILRSINEFIMLFPDKKITTNNIHEWCAFIFSKKAIRRVLSRNFLTVGSGNHTYYEMRS